MTIHNGSASPAQAVGTRPNGDAQLPELGMLNDVKNLYKSKPDANDKTSWVDKYPDDLEAAAENAETARYAMLVRNKKCYDGRKSLTIDSIVVQSPLLKAALGRVLKHYPGITTSLNRLTFTAPFQPFVHRWADLVQTMVDETDSETKKHLELLHRVLELELRDELKARDDYLLNGVITWDTCWMIFEPGSIVFSMSDGQQSASKLGTASYASNACEGPFYSMRCSTVNWDGEKFGSGTAYLKIHKFEGTMKITELPAFPLEYHASAGKVREELIDRGKVFESLCGYHYKYYQGIGIGINPWGKPIRYNVDSRIIIDTYAWNRFNPDRQVRVGTLENTEYRTHVSNNRVRQDGDDDSNSDDDEVYDSDVDSFDEPAHGGDQQIGEAKPLSRDQLLLCDVELRGYSLKNKEWLIFSIGSVKPIIWNTDAFSSLVLPSDHKELILALTESQACNKDGFDDVIQGKGKGMIMLLSGPPGVGKTLTAESVAETMHAPLYMMSAGDLGMTSSEVETSLSNVLEMATKWNAILLLDEADVFLEQRSSNDLERNKLVSIFLRILEYYEGILFLTTNRVDNIDAAFQSRIHISMQYGELSQASRLHVWKNFLAASSTKAKPHFSDADLDSLAGHKMNGREIKNVLKTAQLLASRKKSELRIEHVESVLAIEQRQIRGI